MSSRSIMVLHVEDEESQRRLVAHHLRSQGEFEFEVRYADAEETALDAFRSGGFEFVILDYNLRQGDGLHCLEVMRELDPVVPIIALSGAATIEVAAELVQAGADDYIDKRDLTGAILARRMRDALERADAWKHWGTGQRV